VQIDQNDYSLRPATEDDIISIAAIESRVHRAPWSAESFKAELIKPFCRFYALTDDETDEKIAGYIVCWILDRECRVLNVAVDLPYRGLGFGKKLVRAVIQTALEEDANRAGLEVRKSNVAALQLYQSIGFTITQVRKEFYSDGEDAYMMDLPLEGTRADF
jgi:[ribosomal protein S18]-alanine N-acetyltransferase